MSDLKDLINRIDPAYGKYINVGKGWEKIICDCNEELTELDPNYKIFQIKEKFGDLRFYYQPSDAVGDDVKSKMNEVVWKYEQIASKTCEETGLPGVKMRSSGGWIKTLNPEHAGKKHAYAGYTEVIVSY